MLSRATSTFFRPQIFLKSSPSLESHSVEMKEIVVHPSQDEEPSSPKSILDEDPLEQENTISCANLSKLKNGALVTTFIDALSEAAETTAGLVDSGVVNPGTIAATVITQVGYSMGLNGKTVKEEISVVCDVITKGLPQSWPESSARKDELLIEWPALTPKQESSARWFAGPLIAYTLFTDCASSFYFIKALPSEYKKLQALPTFFWNGLAVIVVGGGVAPTSLLTKGTGTYKQFRKFNTLKEAIRACGKVEIVCIVAGTVMGIFDALEEIGKSYMTIKKMFGLNHSIGLMTLNFAVAPANVFFSAGVISGGLIDFFHYLPQIPYEKKSVLSKKVIALAFAFAAATYLALYRRAVTKQSYDEDTDDFFKHNDDNELYILILSWISFLQEALTGTISMAYPLYPMIVYLCERFSNKVDASLILNDEEAHTLKNNEPAQLEDILEEKLTLDSGMITLADNLKKDFEKLDQNAIEMKPLDTPPISTKKSLVELPASKEKVTHCKQTMYPAQKDEIQQEEPTNRNLSENKYLKKFSQPSKKR